MNLNTTVVEIRYFANIPVSEQQSARLFGLGDITT